MAQIEQNDDMGLVDMWATIRRYKLLILISPTLGAVAAYIFVAFMVAPTWEASAILQVGQVGQVGQASKQVEPIPNVLSRMTQPSFAVKALEESNLNSDERRAAEVIYKSTLKVTKVTDADLVEFKLRGYSVEMARSLAEGTISYVQKLHEEMMSAGVTRIKAQIKAVDEDLKLIQEEADFLKRKLQGNHDWSSYNATLAATVLQDKGNQLRSLTQTKLFLTEQLSPTVTFTTRVVGDLTVSGGPVSPKKLQIIGLAILLGLFGGLFVAFVHNAIAKSKEGAIAQAR
ncbi:MAG: Wzz/FepE/Etk N-terminal domain-containing protein [Pseudomonadota bacterium]